MHEEIIALAAQLTGQEADALLENLCTAAEAFWKERLKAGITPEACGAAFRCAAALTAAAGLTQGEAGTFRAGSVAVTTAGGGDFRAEAAALMRPYTRDDGFAFLGVRG